MELRLKGRRFDTNKEIDVASQEVIDTRILELPGMHEIMGNTLGSLCACPRELLRRRRWKLGVTVRNFLWSNSPNFLVVPLRLQCYDQVYMELW